jgi:hypothetical protein
MMGLAPERANRENLKLLRDPTGVNIFLEARKDGGES